MLSFLENALAELSDIEFSDEKRAMLEAEKKIAPILAVGENY